ncbi:MAG: hypothetical protein B7733_13060 [Myxococcales bacterium FL481]|nr:MAG: hypothetical protein B7733_13060 [Myxococcales bacterium FL481]
MGFPAVRGLNVINLINPQEPGNTSVSAVIDRNAYERADSFAITLKVGAAGAASLYSNISLQLSESDTVSGTAASMTDISGAGISGLTASGQCGILVGSLAPRKRFLGVQVSVPTTSGFLQADLIMGDNAAFPPGTSVDGFTTVVEIA